LIESWVRVALVRLLLRLDAALGKAIAENTAIDEVLPEIKRRATRLRLNSRLA
jgi:hypothetical protein